MSVDAIEAKISSFQASRPDLANMSRTEVISIMLKEGVITQKELENLPNLLSSTKDLPVGDNITIQAKSQAEQPIKQKTHEKYPFLLLNDEDNIDPNQFTLESFKQRYGKEYTVAGNGNYIEVKNKNGFYKVVVNKNTYLGNNNIFISYNPENIQNTPVSLTLLQPKNSQDIHISNESYFDKVKLTNTMKNLDNNGNVKDISVRNKDNEITDYTEYIDGEQKELIKDGKPVFIDNVQKILKNPKRKFLGIADLKSNEEKDETLRKAESGLDFISVSDFLMQYEEKAGSNYIFDVVKYFDNDIQAASQHLKNIEFKRSVLTSVLEKKTENMDFDNNEQRKMYEKDYEKFTKNAEEYDTYLTKTLKEAIKSQDYQKISLVWNLCSSAEVLKKYPNLINDINSTSMADDEKGAGALLILIDLLNQPRDSELINIVCNSDLKYLFSDNNEHLYKLSKSVKTDQEKEALYVDILRAANEQIQLLSVNSSDNTNEKKAINGKIDLDFKQGATGDCWLLSGLMALKDRPNGEEYLNSLLKYDNNTNNVTVNLKGVNKKYTISKDEIDNSSVLSTGDGDIRALEIAFNKYMGEKAKEDRESSVDIDGNQLDTAWQVFVGNSNIDIQAPSKQKVKKMTFVKPDVSKYDSVIDDFNNPNKSYTFGVYSADMLIEGDMNKFVCTDTDNNETVAMIPQHAYSVVKADKDFVYFRNPHDSSKLYKVPKDFFKTFYAEIASTNLPLSE